MSTPQHARNPSALQFLIVDDHPVTRAGTRMLLEQTYPACICQETATLAEAGRQLAQQRWSLMILDQNFPDGRGLEFLKSLPHPPPTMILTMLEEPGMKMAALRAGAKGFTSKSVSPTRILSAIRSILAGDNSFSDGVDPVGSKSPTLSRQEGIVLKGMLAGKRLVEIASEVGVSPTTIQTYKNRLFTKFAVDTNAELVKVAINRGLTEPESRPIPAKRA